MFPDVSLIFCLKSIHWTAWDGWWCLVQIQSPNRSEIFGHEGNYIFSYRSSVDKPFKTCVYPPIYRTKRIIFNSLEGRSPQDFCDPWWGRHICFFKWWPSIPIIPGGRNSSKSPLVPSCPDSTGEPNSIVVVSIPRFVQTAPVSMVDTKEFCFVFSSRRIPSLVNIHLKLLNMAIEIVLPTKNI